jgi:hypothetical protein
MTARAQVDHEAGALGIPTPPLNAQLAGTVTIAGADFAPTSEVENNSITLLKSSLDRTSVSEIRNQRPL